MGYIKKVLYLYPQLIIVKHRTMKLPKRINPDNLVETIVEIRMSPLCPPELWAGMVSLRLQDSGYKYIPAPQLNVKFDKTGKMAVSVERGKDNATYGIFIKDNIRFVMQENSLSFNCNIGHYVGWGVYLQEIKDIISTVQMCNITNSFNRVQIRYISEYPNIDIIDHINGTINIGTSIGAFNSQEIKLNRKDKNMKVYVSLINKMKRKNIKGEERIFSLFDVNVYENFQDSSSIEFVIEILDKIHRVEKETFFGLLKESFIQSLNPEY